MKKTFQDVETLLLDIEGTICPITFVKDTLFPYALRVLPDVLKSDWDKSEFAPYKQAFPDTAKESPDAFLAHVQDLTHRDVKVAYLKNLQGYLWESGYKNSAYATPLFSDVVPALQSFKSTGKSIAIYSSGSVFAQKLLFAHVASSPEPDDKNVVDLTSLVESADQQGESWFDTTNAGLKTEIGSYKSIAQKLGEDPSRILFLSDNVKEVTAALEAGMRSIVVDRPGNAPLTASDRTALDIITSFEELHFDGSIGVVRPRHDQT